MLDVRASSIIYQSQVAVAQLTDDLVTSKKLGKAKDPVWDKLFKIAEYLTALQYSDRADDTTSQTYILECLIVLVGINDFPASPILAINPIPNILVGEPGNAGGKGDKGDKGDTGVATDFLVGPLIATGPVDSFSVTIASAVRWDYLITEGGGAQRAGSVIASWSVNGTTIDFFDNSHPDIIGSTAALEFNVVLAGATIIFQAVISSGNWLIRGSRYFIPNNGNGAGPVSSVLLDGRIFVGNSGNVATGVLASGAITISNTGVTTLSNSVVSNVNIVAAAGIAVNKLAALTASRLAVSDASGFLTTVSVTSTEAGYLAGATSNLQAQITAGLVPILTASRAVITNGSGVLSTNPALSTNRLTKWNGTQFTDSLVSDDGTTVTISSRPIVTSNVALLSKVINLGDWNMDTTASLNVAHGLDFTKIRSVSGLIRDDANTAYSAIGYDQANNGAGNKPEIGFAQAGIGATNILLRRTDSSIYDSTNYDSTSYNRGFLTIFYEA